MEMPKVASRKTQPVPLSTMTTTTPIRPVASSGMSSITGIGFSPKKKRSIPGLVVPSPIAQIRTKIAP